MNFNNYTQKSLEAVQAAQSIARSNNHQQMEQVHLLLALLRQEGGLIPQLLRKMDISVESLEAAAQAELNKIPGVTGSRIPLDSGFRQGTHSRHPAVRSNRSGI